MRRQKIFFSLSIITSLLIIFTVSFIKPFKPFFLHLNYLLGQTKPTSYLILLGNDTEMRANGGFVGSYAKLIISTTNSSLRGGIPTWQSPKSDIDLSFQDIYVPNGQLKGYVTPPTPVQEAFQHGTWMLANADWEPDFPTAANTLRWFFEKGNEINPDNLILLNLTTIKKVVDVVGSFHVSEYEADITPENLYLFLQGKAEVNFFPGSTQKKDALTAVGQAFKKAIFKLPLNKKIQIAQIIYQDLQNQNIVINSTNTDFQSLLEKQNFAGKLSSSTTDTYLLVETNLAANKSNAYVQRQTQHDISFKDNQTSHAVSINFQNNSTEAYPNPPFHYGGDYRAFLRFYIPSNAQNIQAASPSSSLREGTPTWQSIPITPSITQNYGLTEVGFWHTTPAQGQTEIKLSYDLPISKENYSLTILKQHGFISSPQMIFLNKKTFNTNLTNDYLLSL